MQKISGTPVQPCERARMCFICSKQKLERENLAMSAHTTTLSGPSQKSTSDSKRGGNERRQRSCNIASARKATNSQGSMKYGAKEKKIHKKMVKGNAKSSIMGH